MSRFLANLLTRLGIKPDAYAQVSNILNIGCYLLVTLGLTREIWTAPYLIQDDARQHVAWMQRFTNAQLFPHDLITDYFQSVAPLGYSLFYKGWAMLGLSPITVSKWLPFVLLAISLNYGYKLALKLLPHSLSALLVTLLLYQSILMKDDLISATPRSFIYPGLLAFLYYYVGGQYLRCLIAIICLSLFYPPYVPILVGTVALSLIKRESYRLNLSRDKMEYGFCLGVIAVVSISLLPFLLSTNKFGPTVTVAQAQTWPEFLEFGRTRFFISSPWEYWLWAERTGLIPMEWLDTPLKPYHFFVGILLPLLSRYPQQFPLVNKLVNTKVRIVGQLTIVALLMFIAAHLLLFKLYLPSRFSQHTLRVVMSLTSGITWAIILHAFYIGAKKASVWGHCLVRLIPVLLLIISFVLYPFCLNLKSPHYFPNNRYIVGQEPALYKFLSSKPTSIVVASLSEEANNLPSFAQRSSLVGRECAIPYHVVYYQQFRERTIGLINAQYTDNLVDLQNFIKKYGVTYIVLDNSAFTPQYLINNPWLQQYQPATKLAIAKLSSNQPSALQTVIDKGTVFKTKTMIVLQADLITKL